MKTAYFNTANIIFVVFMSHVFNVTNGISCQFPQSVIKQKYSKIAQRTDKLAKQTCEWNDYFSCCDSGKYTDPFLGTFEQGPHTPWCHQGAIPQDVSLYNIKFFFSTPNGLSDFPITYDQITSVKYLELDTNRELWIIVHGFGCDPKDWWMPQMRDALLKKGYNVILVYWRGNKKNFGGSCPPNYYQAASNTRVTGAAIARLATLLMQTSPPKLNLSTTTIVGFSLGAHVAGYAGARLPGLQKIIGIDPAGPLYGGCSPETRLNPNNANFVQAIHCNGADFCCGSLEPMGHIDFYANGGSHQPKCDYTVQKPLSFDAGCSHLRCPYVFTTSILNSYQNGCKYQGYPANPLCNSPTDWDKGLCFGNCDPKLGCPVPGFETSNETPFSGKFYFGTMAANDSEYSYCGRTYKITLISGSRCGILGTGCSITSQLIGPTFSGSTETLINGGISYGSRQTHISMFHWSTLPTQIRVCYSSPFLFITTFDVKLLKVKRDDGLVLQTASNQTVNRNQCSVLRLMDYGVNEANI